jgi:hypothetical protein
MHAHERPHERVGASARRGRATRYTARPTVPADRAPAMVVVARHAGTIAVEDHVRAHAPGAACADRLHVRERRESACSTGALMVRPSTTATRL